MPVIKKNPLFYILKPVTGLMIKVSKFIVLYTISPSPMQALKYILSKNSVLMSKQCQRGSQEFKDQL